MSDLKDLQPISEIAVLLPLRNGRPPSVGTIRRWIAKGTRGVKLQGWRIGGIWYSTPAAIQDFVRASNQSSVEPVPSSRAHKAAIKRRLEEEGLIARTIEEVFTNKRRAKRRI